MVYNGESNHPSQRGLLHNVVSSIKREEQNPKFLIREKHCLVNADFEKKSWKKLYYLSWSIVTSRRNVLLQKVPKTCKTKIQLKKKMSRSRKQQKQLTFCLMWEEMFINLWLLVLIKLTFQASFVRSIVTWILRLWFPEIKDQENDKNR